MYVYLGYVSGMSISGIGDEREAKLERREAMPGRKGEERKGKERKGIGGIKKALPARQVVSCYPISIFLVVSSVVMKAVVEVVAKVFDLLSFFIFFSFLLFRNGQMEGKAREEKGTSWWGLGGGSGNGGRWTKKKQQGITEG
jgi:hypothetical protein